MFKTTIEMRQEDLNKEFATLLFEGVQSELGLKLISDMFLMRFILIGRQGIIGLCM